MTDDTARTIAHAVAQVREGIHQASAPIPAMITREQVRAAAQACDVRALLDLWSVLAPEECINCDPDERYPPFRLLSGRVICPHPWVGKLVEKSLASISDAVFGAVIDACQRRGWEWRASTRLSKMRLSASGAVCVACVMQEIELPYVEDVPAKNTPAVALVGAYLLGILATRDTVHGTL